ncbi:hypothetical protein ZS48_003028 [Salmonella enterica subsp. enterica]|nr:hypothetical protein [Salmonella enterica subsp. enterica serovar Javiana]
MTATGTSGAGKTGLVQPILRSVLDSGGIAWVFDMGNPASRYVIRCSVPNVSGW